MPRIINSNAATKLATKLGTEPINILEIFWTSGSVGALYADKTITEAPGKILSLSNLDQVMKVDDRGTSVALSITLDDSDGSLKTLFDSNNIHKKQVIVYQHFEGLAFADKFKVFKGYVASPIEWNEGLRQLSFDVMSKIEAEEVGFAPEEGQLEFVDDDLVGRVWPLAFGNVVHVPVTKASGIKIGTTLSAFGYPDPTLPYRRDLLLQKIGRASTIYLYYRNVISYVLTLARTPQVIRSEYIATIIQEDAAKQEREDALLEVQTLDTEIQELIELLPEALTSADRIDLQSAIDAKLARRLELAQSIAELTADLSDLEVQKKILELETDTAEYEYQVIGEIRKKLESLLNEYAKLSNALQELDLIYAAQRRLIKSSINVLGGEKFPQNQSVKVTIAGVAFAGSFSGRTFTIGTREALYKDVSIGPRQENRPDSFWITDSSIRMEGNYALLTTGDIIKINQQVGTQCIFELVEDREINRSTTDHEPKLRTRLKTTTEAAIQDAQEHTAAEQARMIEQAIGNTSQGEQIKAIRDRVQSLNELLAEAVTVSDATDVQNAIFSNVGMYNSLINNLEIPETIEAAVEAKVSQEEFSVLLRLDNLELLEQYRAVDVLGDTIPDYSLRYVIVGSQITGRIREVSPIILDSWIPRLNEDQLARLPSTGPWIANPGSNVVLFADYQEKFIANIIPSTIKGVFAYKNVDNIRRLVPVPTPYYQKNENEVLGFTDVDSIFRGLKVTSIKLRRPLADYVGEGWEDQLYVTMDCSVGPLTTNIIKWIIENYSTLTADSGSFANVAISLANYPSSFALFDKRNVIDLIEDIAWQSRCRAVVKEDVVYITYESQEPTDIATITVSDIEADSLSITTTETEDLVTKFIAEWKPSYEQERPNQVVLRHNFTRYGKHEQKYNFFIYNIQELVVKSATFRMIRAANTWKKVKFTTFLTKLIVETGDCIQLDFGLVATDAIKAVVTKADYDSANQSVTIEAWTPVRLGEMIAYNFAWPAGISQATEFPTFNDVIAGNAGNPIGIYVPTGHGYTGSELTLEQIQLRPKDWGDRTPSDASDILPPAPTVNFAEEDYALFSAPSYTDPVEAEVTTFQPNYTGLSNQGRTLETKTTITNVINQKPGNGGDRVLKGVVYDYVQENTYQVSLDDGRLVNAYQRQINSESRIPKGTHVDVSYSALKNTYEILVPVWLPGSN